MRVLTRWFRAMLFLPTALAGCGGEFAMTVPEQVGTPGAELPVVIRLQRYELPFILQSVEEAPMRLQIADGLERAAYTDELGYAGTTLPAPEEPGRHSLRVAVQNQWGEQAVADVPVYVWRADSEVAAVDFDSLPSSSDRAVGDARRALLALETQSRILYLTRRPTHETDDLRAELARCAYPDGPILVWRRTNRYFARSGPLRAPQIVVEARMVRHVGTLKESFPNLGRGVCVLPSSAKAFADAGVTPVIVGESGSEIAEARRYPSWAALADALQR